MSDVVITACAALSAAGEGPARVPVWTVRDGVRTARDETPLRTRWPAAPERAGRMDRFSANALLVAHRALQRAPFDGASMETLAVIVGTALGCSEVNDRYHRRLVEGGAAAASPLLFAQTIPSTPAGEIAIAFGAKGYSTTMMTGRASGVAAVREACSALRLGRAEAALVIAGDALGDDGARLRSERRQSEGAEAMVCLVLEREGCAHEALARIEQASVSFGGEETETAVDWLGASALMELAAWLEEGVSPDFSQTLCDRDGYACSLRARR